MTNLKPEDVKRVVHQVAEAFEWWAKELREKPAHLLSYTSINRGIPIYSYDGYIGFSPVEVFSEVSLISDSGVDVSIKVTEFPSTYKARRASSKDNKPAEKKPAKKKPKRRAK